MIAISTAFKTAQIAMSIKGQTSFCELDANCKHSENVMLKIDHMLDEIKVEIKDNDCFAVLVGPGSFTGLRIGIALVKGLCAGTNAKVVPISSLGLIAYSYVKQFAPKEDFYTIINALSGLLFVCKYDKTGKAITSEQLLPVSDVLKLSGQKVCLNEDNLSFFNINLRGQDLLEMAENLKNQGVFVDYHQLEPVYLRKSQAESMLDAKKV